ncbi:Uncharacterised protein [uncultured archaeon]|nr:Uncharacterised protein [uncultured archaeon]
MDRKKIILLLIGAVFFLAGLYYRLYDPAKSNIAYEYIGIGTWSAGIVYYGIFKKYREITSLLLGLLVLHTGVILLLAEKVSNQKLLGVLVFAAGIIVVLNSGFSDYLERRRLEK